MVGIATMWQLLGCCREEFAARIAEAMQLLLDGAAFSQLWPLHCGDIPVQITADIVGSSTNAAIGRG